MKWFAFSVTMVALSLSRTRSFAARSRSALHSRFSYNCNPRASQQSLRTSLKEFLAVNVRLRSNLCCSFVQGSTSA